MKGWQLVERRVGAEKTKALVDSLCAEPGAIVGNDCALAEVFILPDDGGGAREQDLAARRSVERLEQRERMLKQQQDPEIKIHTIASLLTPR